MKRTVCATLISTPWGYAIDLEGRLGYLSYHGNVRDFEIGKEYECEIFYRLIYALYPDKPCKEWMFLDGDTLEDIKRHQNFRKYDLDISDAYPNFCIRKK